MTASSAIFRFDERRHEYIDPTTGGIFPHITGMLEETGWTDSTWYTEESRIRGSAVHRLTAHFDLGALDLASCKSRYRGWLLAHAAVMEKLRPEVLEVEQPRVHPQHRYGGTLDRVWRYAGALVIPEIKSGDFEKSHPIQTALQAILVERAYGIPASAFLRFGIYLKESGKHTVTQFKERRDFDEARRIIKCCC